MSTDNRAPAKASAKQILANRTNAQRSTGPKTRAGKALVALNSVAHGIYSVSPAIEGVESKRSWTVFRLAMLDSLEPFRMVETMLAERIVQTAWRLRRVVRYEAESIRSGQEGAMEEVGRNLGYQLSRDLSGVAVEMILDQAKWREELWQKVSLFLTTSDDTLLSAEDAEDLLWCTHEQLGQIEHFDDYWQQLPVPEAWTMSLIRKLIRVLSEQHGKPFEEFLRTLSDHAAEEMRQSYVIARKAQQELIEFRREHLLPDTEILEKVMRYEAHLSRQFHRDLHELQRLQALRLGHHVATPIAIDVDVTGGPNSEPGGAE